MAQGAAIAASARLRVKVCCIQSIEEARLALTGGADALGLVGRMPSGPGPIPDDLIRTIADALPRDATSVLLTSEAQTDAVVRHVQRCGTRAVQLVDRVEAGTAAALRETCPGVAILQVIHVRGPASVDEALAASADVDLLLLDSGAPTAATRTLGGTGRVHDWAVSAEIVRQSPVPVWLAGGLLPENVAEAVAQVGPAGVDVCSGLRPNGLLDPDRLAAFVRAARG